MSSDKGGLGGTIIRYLESQYISNAAKKLAVCIKKYDNIVCDIEKSTAQLLADWHGKGKNAFEKDYNTVYRQLKDISDIMYELREQLIDAEATYIKTDEEIAKSFEVASE